MFTERIAKAVDFIREGCGLAPSIAMVLGSGLGDLADEIKGFKIPYGDIPGFPTSTAPSHKGVLHIGTLFGCTVVLMQGRVHMYEGYTPQEVALPMQIMGGLGAKIALITNAVGGINSEYTVTDLALVEDHLSLANLGGSDPLRGQNDPDIGRRFVSMNGAYSKRLLKLANETAEEIGLSVRQGTYAFVTGPTFETPAEIRALRAMGCDFLGMSTVPEVIAARHRNMEVIAISAVTNMAVSSIEDDHITNEEEVWKSVELIKPELRRLVSALLPRLELEGAG